MKNAWENIAKYIYISRMFRSTVTVLLCTTCPQSVHTCIRTTGRYVKACNYRVMMAAVHISEGRMWEESEEQQLCEDCLVARQPTSSAKVSGGGGRRTNGVVPWNSTTWVTYMVVTRQFTWVIYLTSTVISALINPAFVWCDGSRFSFIHL